MYIYGLDVVICGQEKVNIYFMVHLLGIQFHLQPAKRNWCKEVGLHQLPATSLQSVKARAETMEEAD